MIDLLIKTESPLSSDAGLLLSKLEHDLLTRYPHSPVYGVDLETLSKKGVFLMARVENLPIGCGALYPKGDFLAEVKRVFVDPAFRGRGVAKKILERLEIEGRKLGFKKLCLETGTRQPESMKLYESAGYHRIPPFGEYAWDPLCVAYEKEIESLQN